MPIEVKEMHINIKVNYASDSEKKTGSAMPRQEEIMDDSKEMMEEYYEAVLEQINNQKER